jgi:excisionase family DNA binding protein
VADLLQISERHAWRLLARHAVPGTIRMGRVVRLARAAVDDWIARRCPPAQEVTAHVS